MSHPQFYIIRTLADIYNLPTLEQVQTAAYEMAEVIISARLKNDLMAAFIQAQGTDVPNGRAFAFPESVEWIDDGKGEVGLELRNLDGAKIAEVSWKMKGGQS